jgi:hypothetical protein
VHSSYSLSSGALAFADSVKRLVLVTSCSAVALGLVMAWHIPFTVQITEPTGDGHFSCQLPSFHTCGKLSCHPVIWQWKQLYGCVKRTIELN